ncbi:hypothetical protein [Catellatospora sp. NPDC049609]
MSAHFTDKVIPVTGATSGMGRAVAERVTAEGAKVRARHGLLQRRRA